MNRIDKVYKTITNNKNYTRVCNSAYKNQPIKILVFCYVYNHEKYIAQCLDGMLAQFVDFNVKIIVHDDNSTDSSLNIIESYRKKYPSIIDVISQKKNLYDKSHGLLPIFKYLRKCHNGEYIAICEGDDYWKDPYKLAFQTRIMDLNKSLSFCVHKVDVMDDKTKAITRTIPAKKFKLKSGILNSQKFISLTSIRYPFQTSSYFFRTNDFSNFLDQLPLFAEIMPTEDESLLLYFGHLGNTCYLNKSLSVYRKFSDGSWSNDHKNANMPHQGNERLRRMIDAVTQFDKYTEFSFHESCENRITKHEFRILMNDNEIDKILSDHNLRRYFKKQYFKEYCSINIKRLFKRNKK